MTDTILLLDQMGRILFLATDADEVLGEEPDYWIGQSALDLVHPDDLTTVVPRLRSAIANPDASQQQFIRIRIGTGKEDRWFAIELHGFNPCDFKGTPAALVSVRDTTGRLAVEQARNIADRSIGAAPRAVEGESVAHELLSRAMHGFPSDMQALLMHITITNYDDVAASQGADFAYDLLTIAAARIVERSRKIDLIARSADDSLLVLYLGTDAARHASRLTERVFQTCLEHDSCPTEVHFQLGYALASEGDDYAAVEEFAANAAQFTT